MVWDGERHRCVGKEDFRTSVLLVMFTLLLDPSTGEVVSSVCKTVVRWTYMVYVLFCVYIKPKKKV